MPRTQCQKLDETYWDGGAGDDDGGAGASKGTTQKMDWFMRGLCLAFVWQQAVCLAGITGGYVTGSLMAVLVSVGYGLAGQFMMRRLVARAAAEEEQAAKGGAQPLRMPVAMEQMERRAA